VSGNALIDAGAILALLEGSFDRISTSSANAV
jgi:hypothetical protein